jgi:hypothetical protein
MNRGSPRTKMTRSNDFPWHRPPGQVSRSAPRATKVATTNGDTHETVEQDRKSGRILQHF